MIVHLHDKDWEVPDEADLSQLQNEPIPTQLATLKQLEATRKATLKLLDPEERKSRKI